MTVRGQLRDLDLLMGGRHAQVGRGGQVRAARARPLREMRHRPVRVLAPGQVRARRPRLLARVPPLPLAPLRVGGGGVRPGWSSSDGGSEELPEFRDAARSSLASRSSSSPTRTASAAFCAASNAMSWPCSAISASRAASSGLAVTDHHHPGTHLVIKATRWAGHQEIITGSNADAYSFTSEGPSSGMRLGPAAEPLGRSPHQTARRSGRRVLAWKATARGPLPRNTSLWAEDGSTRRLLGSCTKRSLTTRSSGSLF